jgi:hypothetical protein
MPNEFQQLFESVTSSLPPTQIIGESQSLSQRTQVGTLDQSYNADHEQIGQSLAPLAAPRSPSPDPFALLDGISLSSEGISAIHISPSLGLPRHPATFPNTQDQQVSGDDFRGLLRLRPSSSVVGAPGRMTQWEPQASPPANLLGITLSNDPDIVETASEAEAEVATLPRPLINSDGGAGISLSFESHSLTQGNSIFYGIPSSSLGGE